MSVVAIIQARMSSTRLPGKVMKILLGKTVLWHIVNRVSRCSTVDKVVVATTMSKGDDVIYNFCADNNIPVFRGSEDDVLDRYYKCAKEVGASTIVRITADCPLHDPKVIDTIVEEFLRGHYDYVSNVAKYTFPDGLDTEVFSFESLENAWKNAKLPSEREHVTSYIRNCKKFKTSNVESSKKYYSYRLALDTHEDYDFVSRVYDGIGKELFGLDDIVVFLDKHPNLLSINQHIKMNEGYEKSLFLDKVADARNAVITGDSVCIRAVKERAEKPNRTDSLFYEIFLKGSDRQIGDVRLKSIDFYKKTAILYISINERNARSHEIEPEVIKLITQHMFSKLSLAKIILSVDPENKSVTTVVSNTGLQSKDGA